MSGPLLDRIDVHVVLPPVEVGALQAAGRGESSEEVRGRVAHAWTGQVARQAAGEVGAASNASLSPRDLERVAALCVDGKRLLAAAVERLGLSARAYGKVLRVARTIADLDGATAIGPPHVAEAIALRIIDRGPLAAAA